MRARTAPGPLTLHDRCALVRLHGELGGRPATSPMDDAELLAVSAGAAELYTSGRLEEAKLVMQYLADVDPYNASHHLALGTIALDEGAWNVALVRFDLAVAFFGGALGAHAGRALALGRLGRDHDADRDAALAHDLDPEQVHLLTQRLVEHEARLARRADELRLSA